MQSLATVNDFLLAFPESEAIELSDLDDETPASLSSSRLEQGLLNASAEIYFQMRIPVADTSAAVLARLPIAQVWCINIARYRLDSYAPRDDVRQRYEDSLKQMADYLDQFDGDSGSGSGLGTRPIMSINLV
jgi:phage gp36-like protein